MLRRCKAAVRNCVENKPVLCASLAVRAASTLPPLLAVLLGAAAVRGDPAPAPPVPAVPPAAAVDADDSDPDESPVAADPGAGADALRALATQANLHRRRGDYGLGLAAAREGLARAAAAGDQRLQVDFLYLLGRLHWALSDYPRSLESHLEELKLAERLGDESLLARTHGGLGLTYLRYGRSEDALAHIRRGLEHAVRAGDDRIRSSLLNTLGNYHLERRELDRAAVLHEEALALRERYGNRRAIAESLTNLGLVADARGETARALGYLGRALEMFEALRYRRYIANTHRRLALVLRRAGRTDEALGHLAVAGRVAATLDSPEVAAEIERELALTHEARGDLAAALASERRLAAATERARNESDRRRMDELRARYGAEQRELEIALLRREQELQRAELRERRSQNLALGSGLVVGVTVLGAVIVVQLVRLRSERRLRAATEHARERAETAERLKSRLLQMASHDLKVPLSALHATAGLIGRRPGDPATVARLAGGIQADTARMRNLVRDFLDAAAIEEGNLQVHATALDLGAVAAAAVESLQAVAAHKGQTLVLVPPSAPLPPVRADADRLRQVFDNLVGNALKFTPPGGTITVALGESGPWAAAEVRDTGPGLGPDDFARIFTPRAQLSAQPTGGEESSGLGLFIARELLALQGGRLEVQSQPGKGATFRVLLPTAPADAVSAGTG